MHGHGPRHSAPALTELVNTRQSTLLDSEGEAQAGEEGQGEEARLGTGPRAMGLKIINLAHTHRTGSPAQAHSAQVTVDRHRTIPGGGSRSPYTDANE